MDLQFDPEVFWSLIGGRSVIETPRLGVKSKPEAYAFLKAYGYDMEVEADKEKLWLIHARAVIYLRTQLIKEGESIPEAVADPKVLGEIPNLLLMAGQKDEGSGFDKWA